MAAKTIVVVGASRGIGLELVKYLARSIDTHVVATMPKAFDFADNNIEVLELD